MRDLYSDIGTTMGIASFIIGVYKYATTKLKIKNYIKFSMVYVMVAVCIILAIIVCNRLTGLNICFFVLAMFELLFFIVLEIFEKQMNHNKDTIEVISKMVNVIEHKKDKLQEDLQGFKNSVGEG